MMDELKQGPALETYPVTKKDEDVIQGSITEIAPNSQSLHRSLRGKEVQLFAIGGAIGTSLYVQMGSALPKGGPAGLFIAFVIWAGVMWAVNECFAEMVSYLPVPSPFIRFGSAWVDDALGFAMSYNFYLNMAILVPFEIVAMNIMIGIYIAGGPSGAHLNPVVTIVLYIFRGFPKRQMGGYILAQLLGAFFSGFIAYGIFSSQIHAYIASPVAGLTEKEATQNILNAFLTGLRNDNVTLAAGYFTEFVATAFLALVVLALGDDTNTPPGAGMTALILGFVICVLLQAFGSTTGAALNSTRDLGPRLALYALGFNTKMLWGGNWWLWGPWLACIPGGIVGATLYDICIFTGGESPVNYPRKRVWRAGHKAKKKWARRLRPWKPGKKAKEQEVEGQKP